MRFVGRLRSSGPGRGRIGGLGRRFGWLWAAYAVSSYGTWLGFGASSFIAIRVLHAGAAQVAVISAAGLAAGAVLAVPLGPWIEFRRKRPVMIAMDLVRFGAQASIPLAYVLGGLTVAQLVVVSVVVSAGNIAFTAASGAFVKRLVDPGDLLTANARFESTTWSASVVGPTLGGAAIGLLGPVVTVLADAVSYLLSAVGVTAIGGGEPAPAAPTRRLTAAGLAEGWRYLLVHPQLRRMFVNSITVNGLIMAGEAPLAVLMLGRLGFAPWQYGLAFAVPCIGGLVGSRLARPLAERYGSVTVLRMIGPLRCVWPVGLVLVGPGVAGLSVVIAVEFVLIVCCSIYGPISATYRLRAVDHDRVARVLAAWSVSGIALRAVLVVLWGLLASATGPRWALGSAGVLLIGVAVLLPAVRGEMPEPEVTSQPERWRSAGRRCPGDPRGADDGTVDIDEEEPLMVSRLAHIPGIGVNELGDRADAEADPDMLRLENLDTDVRPPAIALDVTRRAVDDDAANSYLPFEGHLDLRAAAAEHVTRISGRHYDPARECVSVAGGLNGVLNALLAITEPGDEVVIADPIYAGLVNRIRLAGAVPVHVSAVPTPDGWRTDPAELAAAVGPWTAAVLLMGPAMPTGAVFDQRHLDALAGPVGEHDTWILYDAAMERLRFDDRPALHPASHPELADHVITVGSASKELRMIGWRVGWVVAPARILDDVALVGMTNVVCQVGIAQQAVAAALSAPDAEADVARACAIWRERCDVVVEQLADYPVVRPDGGWSLLIDTTPLGLTPAEASRRLFEGGRVAATPMDGWGPSGHRYLRLVFANEPVERLRDLRDRFGAALRR